MMTSRNTPHCQPPQDTRYPTAFSQELTSTALSVSLELTPQCMALCHAPTSSPSRSSSWPWRGAARSRSGFSFSPTPSGPATLLPTQDSWLHPCSRVFYRPAPLFPLTLLFVYTQRSPPQQADQELGPLLYCTQGTCGSCLWLV